MKNFVNHLNVAVGILAGICTIILFCKDLFFKEPKVNSNNGSSISNQQETSNTTYSNVNKDNSERTNQQSPIADKTELHNKTTTNYKNTDKQNLKGDKINAVTESTTDTIKKLQKRSYTSLPEKEKVNFFVTLIKTPVVYYALFSGLLGCFFVGIYDLFVNLFTNFKHGFETTSNVWNWAWNDVTLHWYWNTGVGWHIAISILMWFALVYWSNKKQ